MIRLATEDDHDAIWGALEPVLRAGESYALPRDWDRASALAYRFSPSHEVFVATDDDAGIVMGTYFLMANQQGGGAHVANCGYLTAPHFSYAAITMPCVVPQSPRKLMPTTV